LCVCFIKSGERMKIHVNHIFMLIFAIPLF
jgi:hypothetical protein